MNARIARIQVRAPATVANLGPGFDTLALAVDLCNEYVLFADLRPGVPLREPRFNLSGPYDTADQRMNSADGNLFYRSFQFTIKFLCNRHRLPYPECPLLICEEVTIPPMSGLGASSSACVAGVLAAVGLLDVIYPDRGFASYQDDRPLCVRLANAIDVSPDNICASLIGGLTCAVLSGTQNRGEDGLVHVGYEQQRITDPDLRVVALVPNVKLLTTEARRILEGQLYRIAEVTYSTSRSTMIPMIFASRNYHNLREAMKDSIHQKQRALEFYKNDRNKVMDLEGIFEEVIRAGAYGACISGAGPTLVAILNRTVSQAVESAFRSAFEKLALGNWRIDWVTSRIPENDGANMQTAVLSDPLPPHVAAWVERAPMRSAQRGATPGVPSSSIAGLALIPDPTQPDGQPVTLWPRGMGKEKS